MEFTVSQLCTPKCYQPWEHHHNWNLFTLNFLNSSSKMFICTFVRVAISRDRCYRKPLKLQLQHSLTFKVLALYFWGHIFLSNVQKKDILNIISWNHCFFYSELSSTTPSFMWVAIQWFWRRQSWLENICSLVIMKHTYVACSHFPV